MDLCERVSLRLTATAKPTKPTPMQDQFIPEYRAFMTTKRTLSIFTLTVLTTLFIAACGSGADSSHRAIEIDALEAGATLYSDSTLYESESLLIRKVSAHVYEHTSFLNTESFGRVACNGMVVIRGGEAVVFDTPADEESSRELISYLTKKGSATITAVVATHFHSDCVGGLKAFHDQQIPSYGSNHTIKLLKEKQDQSILPRIGFDQFLELKAGDKAVYAEFFGQGHTKDNVIGYFPEDKVIFGGCLIKEVGAGKGNLEDANLHAWPHTVQKIKQKYPQAELVIPGHGKRGGMELLDYTIQLFQ